MRAKEAPRPWRRLPACERSDHPSKSPLTNSRHTRSASDQQAPPSTAEKSFHGQAESRSHGASLPLPQSPGFCFSGVGWWERGHARLSPPGWGTVPLQWLAWSTRARRVVRPNGPAVLPAVKTLWATRCLVAPRVSLQVVLRIGRVARFQYSAEMPRWFARVHGPWLRHPCRTFACYTQSHPMPSPCIPR